MKNKADILQDSCNYLYQYGFNGTSVENLAQNANITKKTLYRYFASKESLIEDSLDFRHKWFMTQLNRALEHLTGEKVIDGYLKFLKDWLTSDNFYGCMFINACGEFSDKNHIVHQKSLEHKQQVITLLQQKISLGIDDKNQSKKLAEFLFINGEGLIVAMQVGVIDKINIVTLIATISIQCKAII